MCESVYCESSNLYRSFTQMILIVKRKHTVLDTYNEWEKKKHPKKYIWNRKKTKNEKNEAEKKIFNWFDWDECVCMRYMAIVAILFD